MTKISCYHGACLGWGFQADLASSQGSVWWAAREPGARHLGPRRVELCLGVGVGVALLSRAEHPLLCLGHHPSSLPYILMSVGTELTETSSQGNEGREVNQE